MGAITSLEGDKWPESYPPIVSGHIHSRQIIQNNIYYPGSALQHAFGESDKNIIPILTFSENYNYNNNFYKLEEIDLCLPKKKIVYLNIEDFEKFSNKQINLDK